MVEWYGEKVTNAAKIVLKNVSKEVAENVMEDAMRILRRKAETTSERGLLEQFEVVPSKYKDGGFLVYCQGPGKWWPPYHASFVELGTHKTRNQTGKHFMRLAYKRHRRKANKMFQDGLNKL